MTYRSTVFAVVGTLGLWTAVAHAQEVGLDSSTESATAARGFIEVAGAFGFQFGEQPYLPDGAPGDSMHPLTNGFAVNVTAGYQVASGLDLIADYAYSQASSRSGELTNALTDVDGHISFQTIAAGLRSRRTIGPGVLYGELAVGIVLPFETQLDYTYAPALGQLPDPIVGEGRKIDNYSIGVGAHGELGYQWAAWGRVYVAAALRIQSFQSNNNGETTELDNFVGDFTNPSATTTMIEYDSNGGVTPQTYSVQDLRLHVNVGYGF